jgi:hypothetical protein
VKTTSAEDDPLRPIHARSIIQISHRGEHAIDFSQVLEYMYVDTSENNAYHASVVSDPAFVKAEMAVLEQNMQGFLDAEENIVNGNRVFPRVGSMFISFKNEHRYPAYTWLIAWQGMANPGGTCTYQATIEPATLDYPVESIYTLPPNARIVMVESSLPHDTPLKNILVFRGRKGDKVQAVERISWILE